MWDGALSPNLRKSIGTVTFIPLSDMTDEDWDFLDYDNLRATAQNRLAETIVAGELVGFFDVRIMEKARAKNRYLWPATKKAVDDFEDGDHDFFRHQPNTDTVVPAVGDVEYGRNLLSLEDPNRVLNILASRISDIGDAERRRTAQRLLEVLRSRIIWRNFWLILMVLIAFTAVSLGLRFFQLVDEISEALRKPERIAAGSGLDKPSPLW